MTEIEVRTAAQKIARYRQLETLRNEVRQCITDIDKDFGKGQPSPFTGNTRDARDIAFLRITFTNSSTGAGAEAVEMQHPHISAYDFARALRGMLSTKLSEIIKAMQVL